jgi:hypothetical protein
MSALFDDGLTDEGTTVVQRAASHDFAKVITALVRTQEEIEAQIALRQWKKSRISLPAIVNAPGAGKTELGRRVMSEGLRNSRVRSQCDADLGLSTPPDSECHKARHGRYSDIWNSLVTKFVVTVRVGFRRDMCGASAGRGRAEDALAGVLGSVLFRGGQSDAGAEDLAFSQRTRWAKRQAEAESVFKDHGTHRACGLMAALADIASGPTDDLVYLHLDDTEVLSSDEMSVLWCSALQIAKDWATQKCRRFFFLFTGRSLLSHPSGIELTMPTPTYIPMSALHVGSIAVLQSRFCLLNPALKKV